MPCLWGFGTCSDPSSPSPCLLCAVTRVAPVLGCQLRGLWVPGSRPTCSHKRLRFTEYIMHLHRPALPRLDEVSSLKGQRSNTPALQCRSLPMTPKTAALPSSVLRGQWCLTCQNVATSAERRQEGKEAKGKAKASTLQTCSSHRLRGSRRISGSPQPGRICCQVPSTQASGW